MKSLRRLLLEPGESYPVYVLRIFAVMTAGGWAGAIIASALFPEASIQAISDEIARIDLTGMILGGLILRPAMMSGLVATANWLLNRALPRLDDLASAAAIGLACSLFEEALSGPVHAVGVFLPCVAAGAAFVVSRKLSLGRAVLTCALLFLMYDALALLLWKITTGDGV